MEGPKPLVAIVGAGAIGAAFAAHLIRAGRPVALLGTPFDEHVLELHRRGEPHPAIDVLLPRELEVASADSRRPYLEVAGIVLLAVSGDGLIDTARAAKPATRDDAIWAVATKAWDLQTARHAARIVADGIGHEDRVVALAGPSLAAELARGVPTSLVSAGWSIDAASSVANALSSPTLRVDVTDDVDGVAVGSVVKNVAAVAVGICDGLDIERGLNTKAAIFSIALREMADLTLALGGRIETVLGPAGAGDLFVTCLGGRNGRFGSLVGAGVPPREAVVEIGSTVEGYANAATVVALADRFGLDMPLMRAVARVLLEGEAPRVIVDELVHGGHGGA
jgi:glycerol-3-phosphate dehydrogenase (NAD(P)+)